MDDGTLAGRFLIATPVIAGPPFSRSVVFLLEHDDTGAIGVIINRDSGLEIEELVPSAASLVTEPRHVFIGGPVSTDVALAVAEAPEGSFLRPAVLGTIGLVDPLDPPDGVTRLRVFAGYAGWDPGQLEQEIEDGAWWSQLADVEAIFGDPSDLWRAAVRKAPGTAPLYSTFPGDPATN